jgi:hypothetical protein
MVVPDASRTPSSFEAINGDGTALLLMRESSR